jgi:toluene monooxygenase system protein E
MTQHTYWHLQGRDRAPSDYEVVTSRLLYYPERGLEVTSPVARWCNEQQAAAVLQCTNWDDFCDPRETTYSSYVDRAQASEAVIDGWLEAAESSDYDRRLSTEWVQTLESVLPVLRFPIHGLQMVSAHIGSMAQSGRIAVAASFQAADEMRWLQRLAYRTRQLQYRKADFGEHSQRAWQRDPCWQPLRRAIEELLVTYDWTAALLRCALVLKPLLHELFLVQFAKLSVAAGDDLLAKVLQQLAEDRRWHQAWTTAALKIALEAEQNKQRAANVIHEQREMASAVSEQIVQLFHDQKPAGVAFDPEGAQRSAQAAWLQCVHAVGLQA